MSNKIQAQWSISLDVECPQCQHDFDIFYLPDYQEYVRHLGFCKSGEELDIFCLECEHKFTAETIF